MNREEKRALAKRLHELAATLRKAPDESEQLGAHRQQQEQANGSTHSLKYAYAFGSLESVAKSVASQLDAIAKHRLERRPSRGRR